MKKLEFTYSDSEAGMQSESFKSLSSIVKYIEDFGWNGDSEGIIYENEIPILSYSSKESGIQWVKYDTRRL